MGNHLSLQAYLACWYPIGICWLHPLVLHELHHVSTNLRIPPVSHWNCQNPSIFWDKPKLGIPTYHWVGKSSLCVLELSGHNGIVLDPTVVKLLHESFYETKLQKLQRNYKQLPEER